MRLHSPVPLVSICIPTLQGGEHYQRLLHSIAEHTDCDYEIVTVISGQVTGYTRPMNQAMAAGRGSYLVALNDDVLLAPGWVAPLLHAAREGAWCATPACDQHGPVLLYAPHCMLWQASAWRKLGGLDERFIHHGSDIDLARRLHEHGEQPALVALGEPVAHHVSASSRPELGPVCAADLERYEQKWGVSAEHDKHHLAEIWRTRCPS